MIPLLLALLGPALGADLTQEMTWNLQVDGAPVGSRNLTVKYLASEEGTRRILESWTELDGQLGPLPVHYRERLTAHIGREPASFTSVQDTNGVSREVQARRIAMGWRLTVSNSGRARTWDLAGNRIDLSTVDLLDPDTRVPLSRFETARLLSSETGAILEGTVERLGPSSLIIEGIEVPVEGFAMISDGDTGQFYYTADGFLVRYEMVLLGHLVVAELTEPPPVGVDDAPLLPISDGVEEIEL